MVSVCLIVYNHEEYLESLIKNILNQKTNFSYEVIIHDDASTDKSREIIDKYAKIDKRIVKMYEEENQYSQGKEVMSITLKCAYGKYIALIEGDDDWLCENKLQKQVDYLEQHKDCSLCVTNAIIKNMRNNKITKMSPYKKDTIVTYKNYITRKNAFPTASMVFPRKYVLVLPDYYLKSPIGDVPLEIHLLSLGYAYYIDSLDVMYRIFAKNSWSSKFSKSSQLSYYDKMIKIYQEAISSIDNSEVHFLNFFIQKAKFQREIASENYKVVFNKNYRDVLKSYSINNQIKFYFKGLFPHLYKVIKKRSKNE